MARNRYPGTCYCCGKHVPIGYGHFERYKNGWRIKCVKCASGRKVDDNDPSVKKALRLAEGVSNSQALGNLRGGGG